MPSLSEIGGVIGIVIGGFTIIEKAYMGIKGVTITPTRFKAVVDSVEKLKTDTAETGLLMSAQSGWNKLTDEKINTIREKVEDLKSDAKESLKREFNRHNER